MSGTPKVSTEKDGIFGRGMYVWDGSVFRKLLGSTTGLLLSGLRPATNYIPIQISTVVHNSFTSPLRGIGVFNDTLYTVPANSILHLTQFSYTLTGGAVGLFNVQVGGIVNSYLESNGAVGLNAPVVKQQDIYLAASETLVSTYNATVINTQYSFITFGYLISTI